MLLRGWDWVYLLSSEKRWLNWSKMLLMMRLSIFSVVVWGLDASAGVGGFGWGRVDVLSALGWGLDGFVEDAVLAFAAGLGSGDVVGAMVSSC